MESMKKNKKADASQATSDNTKKHINNISDSMEPRTWRQKTKTSELRVSEVTQRELN